MQELYRVETTHDESSFYALAQVQAGLYEADRNRKIKVFGYLFIAAAGVLLALLRQRAVAVVPLGIGCWLLASQATQARARARQMIKSVEGRDLSVAYRFGPDGFQIDHALQHGNAPYDSIVNIVEHEGYYLLFINESTAHLFRKTDFILGDAETFAAFIEEKTGRTVKQHRRTKTIVF